MHSAILIKEMQSWRVAPTAYLQTLLQEERNKPAFKWLTNKEAAKLLDVTPRTMPSWRDKEVLGSGQVGEKICYQQ